MSATHPIPLFIALEPDQGSIDRVVRYKQRVRELVGEQLYLSDPPHMTLYLALFDDVSAVIEVVQTCADSVVAPQLSVAGWHTFVSDPLTGLNTLVLDFMEGDRAHLRGIQQQLVAALAINRDASATLDRINGRWSFLSPLERETACRWGFPYVGEGWHPHLTVASIRPADWPAVERDLLSSPPQGEIRCPRLQLYQLVDDRPQLVEAFPLRHDGERAVRTTTIPQRHDAPMVQQAHLRPGLVSSLKREIVDALWQVVDRREWVCSATLTGSFLVDETIDSISDIDLVVIVDELNLDRFSALQAEFDAALRPLLKRRNLQLRINATLGPLKFNDDATAVLHLMLYSAGSHRQHVINSPFTCFDWQRSETFRKHRLADLYPVFGLQPHHFISGRRGVRDYLGDFEKGVVSYRELDCSATGYSERRREAPMSTRDRYEYAYHVMRFLMQNLLKLLHRTNLSVDGQSLTEQFSNVFPRNADVYKPLYLELRRRKKNRDFTQPIPRMADLLREFVQDFESQFRAIFVETATRHIVFRHAATKLNAGQGGERRFVGRFDPEIEPIGQQAYNELVTSLREARCESVYTSPLQRCRQTWALISGHVSLTTPISDDRLIEIDYGRCDRLTVAEAQGAWPDLFAAWSRGEDPNFPGGESTGEVCQRVLAFANDRWRSATTNSATCTHNVVLRCLVGHGLGVPRADWHRLQIPHLAPITVVQTRDHGWFVDLNESVERQMFSGFLARTGGA